MINIQIKYSMHIDLIFHVLAYMRVNNASDCYSEEYINFLTPEKKDFAYDIGLNIKKLAQYYNDNFEKLAMINFLPFYSDDFDQLKLILVNHNFSAEDKNNFIQPFIEILKNESIFFFPYWQNIFRQTAVKRQAVQSKLTDKFQKYSMLFAHYNKNALLFLSYTITKNGRGFNGINSYFSALVPFPHAADQYDSCFFTALHEYTHQFTDSLLNTNINMQDGSHNLSEFAVILADYYLIKKLDFNSLNSYFQWLAGGIKSNALSEAEFLNIFTIPDILKIKLENLISEIL